MQNKKVALGLSGGVDSAVCAYLLKKQGYSVTAVYIECWHEAGCRAETDKQDALKIALQLDIPFKTLDFKKAYKANVIEYFFAEYKAGRTPNPDVLCNKEIKFGLFYDWALRQAQGKPARFDFIATGHYAGVLEKEESFYLKTAKDAWKDQTYFLHQITAEQLPHILFPLANLNKNEVRRIAKQQNLHVADKKDSVGICFVGDIDVHKMLQERFAQNPGEVVDSQGNKIGQHHGLYFYTIGQRSGFVINQSTLVKQSPSKTISKHNIPPFYVIAKNTKKNQLVVGFGIETYKDEFEVTDLHWINQNLELSPKGGSPFGRRTYDLELKVRIRHTGDLLACKVEKTKKGFKVKLAKAQRGIAAGQFAVFYTPNKYPNYICLGGGVIG